MYHGSLDKVEVKAGSNWWHRRRKNISGWCELQSELSAQSGEGGGCGSTASGTRGRRGRGPTPMAQTRMLKKGHETSPRSIFSSETSPYLLRNGSLNKANVAKTCRREKSERDQTTQCAKIRCCSDLKRTPRCVRRNLDRWEKPGSAIASERERGGLSQRVPLPRPSGTLLRGSGSVQ